MPIPRALLLLLVLALPLCAASETTDIPVWSGRADVGLNLSTGNSESRNYSLTSEARHRAEFTRWKIAARYHFAEEADDSGRFTTSEDRYGLRTAYDRFFSQRGYWLLQAGVEGDRQADLKLRSRLGAGLGYQLRDDAQMAYSVEAGLARIRERHDQPPDENYSAALFAHDLRYSINSHTELTHAAALYPALDSESAAYGSADTAVSFRLTANTHAAFNWSLSWDDSPAAGQRSTDNRFSLSVGWDF